MRTNGTIWLTEQDLKRLRHLIVDSGAAVPGAHAGIDALEEILDFGRVVPVADIPRNVVTMNSSVVFDDLDSGEQRTVTVVYPEDADAASGKVSVLSPVGIALLGLNEGAQTEMRLPRGRTAHIRIRKIALEPEESGNYPS